MNVADAPEMHTENGEDGNFHVTCIFTIIKDKKYLRKRFSRSLRRHRTTACRKTTTGSPRPAAEALMAVWGPNFVILKSKNRKALFYSVKS